jgi:hypothetical protein
VVILTPLLVEMADKAAAVVVGRKATLIIMALAVTEQYLFIIKIIERNIKC